jgi:hypothetical protein
MPGNEVFWRTRVSQRDYETAFHFNQKTGRDKEAGVIHRSTNLRHAGVHDPEWRR